MELETKTQFIKRMVQWMEEEYRLMSECKSYLQGALEGEQENNKRYFYYNIIHSKDKVSASWTHSKEINHLFKKDFIHCIKTTKEGFIDVCRKHGVDQEQLTAIKYHELSDDDD